MLGDALSYLKNSDDWIPTLVIGGVLSVLSALILPAFILQGYYVRVLRGAAKEERAAPSFTDWGGLAVDGIKLFLINIVFALVVLIPTLVVLFAVFGVSSVTTDPTTGAPNAAAGIVGLLATLLVVAFGLIVGYFAPAAYANFAIEDSLGAAFDLSTVLSGAATSEYFKGWLLAIVAGVVLGLVGAALSVVVVGIFVLFYAQVVTYYLFGRGFAAGLAKKRRDVAESNF
ncbi:hypothetical protein C474_01497 [Halogeometricum pallidum JCM 14848]|uniref:DUF4013 domain-containing protein n=1 Tax=Halogeometricum pallidum JCM 14848 TaxID=1227487 RepID=M0DLJ2_HALPD|nr:DUF4013 domain-containing protein [Halogeometricum pallidum]ELZ34994.1 hypothetical protein C474_01497 [Halogeometricum pallidum JCM 14848]